MLPGFRFLFAATVLSMSILIFGLGAAALLRAAHEEIANTPSWRPGPEPKFAQPSEPAAPVLALLRVDPMPAEPRVSDNAPAAAAPEPPPVVAAPAEPDKVAALKPDDPSPGETANLLETAKPDIAVPETPAQQEAPPAQADAAVEPTKMAATEQVLPPASEAAPAAEQAASAPTDVPSMKDLAAGALVTKDLATEDLAAEDLAAKDLAAKDPAAKDLTAKDPAAKDPATNDLTTKDPASMKIATLGGPPVTVETAPTIKAAGAKPEPNAAKQRLQAKRAKERRRVAQRARQAAAQEAADPFSQPTITTRAR